MHNFRVENWRLLITLPVVVVLVGGIAGLKRSKGRDLAQLPDRPSAKTVIVAGVGETARPPRGPRASTTVLDVEVIAIATEDAREVRLSVPGGADHTTIILPDSAGRITELRIGPWVSFGVAVVVEATNEETKETSYHWATANVIAREKRVGRPTGAQFLKSKVNYDMGCLINPESDSIYMVLSRHQRASGGQSVSGYVFIHNCPVGTTSGSVIPFEASQRW
jgi:hypothetical protein